MKCSVKDCTNSTGQGWLCTPCHVFISGEGGLNSQAYRNYRQMQDVAVKAERERITKVIYEYPYWLGQDGKTGLVEAIWGTK